MLKGQLMTNRWLWLGLLCVFNGAGGWMAGDRFGYWALIVVLPWSMLSGAALTVWLSRRSER